MPIEITTLGRFGVSVDGKEWPDFLASKSRCAILIYLGIEREASRDTVAELFWPDRDFERSRHALSQALHEIKKKCEAECISAHGEILKINPDVLSVDAWAFQSAVEGGRHGEALPMYHGPFLNGVHLSSHAGFEEWSDKIRRRIERRHREARGRRIEELIKAGDLPGATAVAQGWVEIHPLEDDAQHRFIRLLASTGRLSEASRQYEDFRRLLQENGIEPLDDTLKLEGEIRAPLAAPGVSVPPAAAAGAEFSVDPQGWLSGEAETGSDDVRPGPGPSSWILRLANAIRSRWVFRAALGYTALIALGLEALERLEGFQGVTPDLLAEATVAFFSLIPLVSAVGWTLDPGIGVGRLSGEGSGGKGAGRLRRIVAWRGTSLLFGGFLSVCLMVLFWPEEGNARSAEILPKENHVAILYFGAPTGDEDLRRFGHQLTRVLISEFTRFAEISPLTVASPGAVEESRERTRPGHEIARSLRAEFLVDGQVDRQGDSVVVGVSLEDPWEGESLWSEPIKVMATGQWEFTLFQQVAERIAHELRPEVGEVIRQRGIELGTSPEAFKALGVAEEQFRTARSLLYETDAEGVLRELDLAENLFEAAGSLDEDWPEPFICIGKVAEQRFLAANLENPQDRDAAARDLQRGLDSVERALALDPGNPRALEQKGVLLYWQGRSHTDPFEAQEIHEEAQRALREAAQSDPTLAHARGMLSQLYLDRGEFELARISARRALDADAFLANAPVLTNTIAMASLNLGEDEQAIQDCRVLHGLIGAYPGLECELEVLAWGDNPEVSVDRAWLLADSVLVHGSSDRQEHLPPRVLFKMVGVLAKAGLADSARAVMNRAQEGAPMGFVFWEEAAAYVQMGDHAAALDVLGRFLEAEPIRFSGIAEKRVFDPLEREERFQNFLSQLPPVQPVTDPSG